MAAKGGSAPLCLTPEVVPFEFHEAQEMHSEITITSQVDSEVSFKIKTNKPGLYLVKPMEGRLQRRDKMKISFKRKELPLKEYLNNQSREKFLIELNAEVVNSFGVTENCQQSSYLGVKFTAPSVHVPQPLPDPRSNPTKHQPPPNIPHQPHATNAPNLFIVPNLLNANIKSDWQKIIAEKKRELQTQMLVKESLELNINKEAPSQHDFKLSDLINLLLVAFLLGFII